MDPAFTARAFDVLDAGVLELVHRERPVDWRELGELYVRAHDAGRDAVVHAWWVAERRAAAGLPPLPGTDPGTAR